MTAPYPRLVLTSVVNFVDVISVWCTDVKKDFVSGYPRAVDRMFKSNHNLGCF